MLLWWLRENDGSKWRNDTSDDICAGNKLSKTQNTSFIFDHLLETKSARQSLKCFKLYPLSKNSDASFLTTIRLDSHTTRNINVLEVEAQFKSYRKVRNKVDKFILNILLKRIKLWFICKVQKGAGLQRRPNNTILKVFLKLRWILVECSEYTYLSLVKSSQGVFPTQYQYH